MRLLESYIYEEVKKISSTQVLENNEVLHEFSPRISMFGVKEREDGNYTKEEQERIDQVYKSFVFIKEEELQGLNITNIVTDFADIHIVTVNESGVVKIIRMDKHSKKILEEHTASFEDDNYVVGNNYFYLSNEGVYHKTIINANGKILSIYHKKIEDGVMIGEKSFTDNGSNESYVFNYKKLFGENDYYEYTALIPKEKSLEESYRDFIDIRDVYTKGYPTKVTNKKRNIIDEDLTIENMDPNNILNMLCISNTGAINPGAINVMKKIYRLDPDKFSHYMYILEKNGIVGVKIYLLYNDMCENNFNIFLEVINGLEQNIIDKEKLTDTLSQTYPEKYTSFMKH